MCSAPGRSSLSSTSRASIGAASRWDKYFQPGKPYLDGYQADFMTGPAVMAAYKSGKIQAEFRGVTPPQRDELVAALGDRIRSAKALGCPSSSSSSTPRSRRSTMPGCGARCRSRSTAGARPKSCRARPFFKYVGGLMRPGSSMATPEAELVKLPGFGHDIAAARAEAKRLLAEAGVHDLQPEAPRPRHSDAALRRRRSAGRELARDRRRRRRRTGATSSIGRSIVDAGNFDVALDFSGDFYDDPTIQLTKYVSPDLSPVNYLRQRPTAFSTRSSSVRR